MGPAVAVLMVALAVTVDAEAAADRQMEMQAREAFAAGRYDEALGLFAKLFAETLHPVYLRNIGRCHQKLRDPQKAIDSFRDYLAKAKTIPADERQEIEGYIREMEQLKDEQAKAQRSPQAGEPSARPVSLAATPPPGESRPVNALATTPDGAPADAASPIYTRWWFWTAIGAVVVGGVVAAVVLSGSNRPECNLPMGASCQ
jgi:hypothetical protein